MGSYHPAHSMLVKKLNFLRNSVQFFSPVAHEHPENEDEGWLVYFFVSNYITDHKSLKDSA